MLKSKALLRKHVQPLLDSGYKQYELARELGFSRPTFVSMLLSDNRPEALLPLNRLERLAELCHLTEREVMELYLARLADGGDIFGRYICKTFSHVVDDYRKVSAASKTKSADDAVGADHATTRKH